VSLEPKPIPPARHAAPWIATALALATVLVYLPVTRCQFVNVDDVLFVTFNPHIRSGLTVEGFQWAWCNQVGCNWHPITLLTHMLDCQLFGARAWWPHLVNVLLHAANATLLFALLQRMTGALWRSAAVAALFALHPLHVESVAWVAERKDVLSTMFWFLSLWAYVRYVENLKSQTSGFKIHYAMSLLFFALGLMSKPMLVSLPFTLLLLDWWPLGRAPTLRLAWEKIPFLALSAAMSVVTLVIQKQTGAVALLDNLPMSDRVGNALISYVRYIGKMIWPGGLAAYYPLGTGHWPWWSVSAAALFLVVVTALVLWQSRRRPWLAAGWFWYVGTLVPVIGLVQVGSQAMADRYTYVPLTGLFVMLVWGGWAVAGARWMAAVMAVVLGACAVLTVHQESYWKDAEIFNKRMIDVTANNPFAHNNLGRLYLDANRTDAAITNLQAAIREKPDYADARNNLGTAFQREGQLDNAIIQFREAIRLRPDFAMACNNLGAALASQGHTREAIAQFSEAVRIKPDYADAHNNLGIALGRNGQLDESIAQFREAIRLEPGHADAHNNLGTVLLWKGRSDEAVAQFREAIRLKPDFAQARNNLARALGKK
jgi:Tfp pilus assembly protein PilF